MTEVVAGSGQSYFDTNPTSHYHYFDKTTGEIIDVPEEAIQFPLLPEPPPGKVIDRIDVVVRDPQRAARTAARAIRAGATPQIADLGSQPSSSADLDPAPVALAAVEQLADHAGLEAATTPSIGSCRAAQFLDARTPDHHRPLDRQQARNAPSRSRRRGPRSGARRRTPRRSAPAGPSACRPSGSDGRCSARCAR